MSSCARHRIYSTLALRSRIGVRDDTYNLIDREKNETEHY